MEFETFTEIIKKLGGATVVAAGIEEPAGRVQLWSQRNSIPSHAWWKIKNFAETKDVDASVENMAQIADKQQESK